MRKPRIYTGGRGLPVSGLGIAATAAVVVLLGGPAALALTALSSRARARTAAAPFTLKATPSARTIKPGQTAHYRIVIQRGARFHGPVTLRITGGLPSGSVARFAPQATRGSSSTLSIHTSAHADLARYRPRLLGTSGGYRQTTVITLALAVPAPAPASGFAIGGSVGDLAPGIPGPVNLRLTNPTTGLLSITGLSMSIQRIDAPHATAALPCTGSDFSIQQYSGFYPLLVPDSSTRTLSELGVPVVEWPHVAVLDLHSDQDGCQGASLTLAYSGSGGFS